jgi:hypothetical protein
MQKWFKFGFSVVMEYSSRGKKPVMIIVSLVIIRVGSKAERTQ